MIFAANVDLAAIRSNEHALSHDNLIQLARVQLHALPIDGCLDLLSMLDVDMPAFNVAHVCHLQKFIHEGHSGFLLIQNESSSRSRMHTKPFLIEEQHLSHRMLIVLQMQTPIIFLSCRFLNNQIP